jgi:hypothetical protein
MICRLLMLEHCVLPELVTCLIKLNFYVLTHLMHFKYLSQKKKVETAMLVKGCF